MGNSSNKSFVEIVDSKDEEALSRLQTDAAQLNARHDAMGTSPFQYCIRKGFRFGIAWCLKAGADPNGITDDVAPLRAAVEAGDPAAVESLVQAGARIDEVTGGVTPLQVAADNGQVECMRTLLILGADPNKNPEGCDLLDMAAQGHRGNARNSLAQQIRQLIINARNGQLPQ